MDLSNLVSSLAGGSGTGTIDPTAAAASVQQLIDDSGGVDGLLKKLEDGGLGEQAKSWVSTGENQPVEPEQLANALGPDTVNKLSATSGMSVQSLLPLLATFLPMLINHLTPNGQKPQAGSPQNQPDIGGMLGGLLGSGGLGEPPRRWPVADSRRRSAIVERPRPSVSPDG